MTSLAAAALNGSGGGVGEAMAIGDIQTIVVPWTVAGSASYATGGDPWTPPRGLPANWTLRQLIVCPLPAATYLVAWNGSATAPTIQFYTLVGTEAASATNLSAITIHGVAVYGE